MWHYKSGITTDHKQWKAETETFIYIQILLISTKLESKRKSKDLDWSQCQCEVGLVAQSVEKEFRRWRQRRLYVFPCDCDAQQADHWADTAPKHHPFQHQAAQPAWLTHLQGSQPALSGSYHQLPIRPGDLGSKPSHVGNTVFPELHP